MMNCPLCQPETESVLWQTAHYRIIAVHNEPNTPAFCRVIWQKHIAEMTDLNPNERNELMNAVYATEAAMREVLQPSKINLASLGNIVPHLHWHIIARFDNDAHFPNPIWTTPQRENTIKLPENWLEQIQLHLQQHLA